jgi:hypothetical protein
MALLAQRGEAPAQPAAPAKPDFDLKAKTKERNAKLLEGDEDAAAALDEEIQNFHKSEAVAAATQAAQNVIQTDRINAAVQEVQRRYPVLDDSRKKSFDPEVLDLVIAQRNLYIGRGMDTATALRKAAKAVCENIGSRKGAREDGGRKPGQLSSSDKVKQMRRAQRQPGRLSQAGASGRVRGDAGGELTEQQIASMPEARFKSLDPKTKARERGDFVGPSKRPKRR